VITPAALEMRDLRVRYGHGRNRLTAVDGVSLFVPPGGTLALVGESGCGKSSLARALVGLAPVLDGTIELDGADVTAAKVRNSKSYRRKVQMIFQDPFLSLNPRMMIGRAVQEAVRIGCDPAARRQEPESETLHMLRMVGLTESATDRYPHQFSGGQLQRIAIARALAVRPRVIIADEITSALDVSVQATILVLLQQLQAEFGLTYLFISHDLSVVRLISDRVAVMYLGRIVEQGPTEEVFETPQHPYTQALMDSVPKFGTPVEAPIVGALPDPRYPPPGCRFHTRCPVGPATDPGRSVCISADPASREIGPNHSVSCHFAGISAPTVVQVQSNAQNS
jgi:peptide/nickel transport system ATP-binding protein